MDGEEGRKGERRSAEAQKMEVTDLISFYSRNLFILLHDIPNSLVPLFQRSLSNRFGLDQSASIPITRHVQLTI
jgi:hypothetical protein